MLSGLLKQVRIWSLQPGTAVVYGELFHELRRKGRALSQVDMIIAALATQMNATLLTTDRDFEAVDGLHTESWASR